MQTRKLSGVSAAESLDVDSFSLAKYAVLSCLDDGSAPLEYVEAASAGAAVVSFGSKELRAAGFVAGDSFCELKSVEEIDALVASGSWKTVGERGRLIVEERHTVAKRARELLKIINEG